MFLNYLINLAHEFHFHTNPTLRAKKQISETTPH